MFMHCYLEKCSWFKKGYWCQTLETNDGNPRAWLKWPEGLTCIAFCFGVHFGKDCHIRLV